MTRRCRPGSNASTVPRSVYGTTTTRASSPGDVHRRLHTPLKHHPGKHPRVPWPQVVHLPSREPHAPTAFSASVLESPLLIAVLISSLLCRCVPELVHSVRTSLACPQLPSSASWCEVLNCYFRARAAILCTHPQPWGEHLGATDSHEPTRQRARSCNLFTSCLHDYNKLV